MICLRPLEIEVRGSDPLELMARVERAYVDRFGAVPEHPGGWYEPDDWTRISRVFELLETGGAVLDVGTGAGQFANCLALSGAFRSVTTIDTARFTNYFELTDDVRRLTMTVAELDFADDSFDVVTCMEVLEHLARDVFVPALAELRRVCRGQLIITVPYREPEPISKTHVRRFEDADFARLFPHADFAILRRPRKPWMLVEEWPNRRPRHLAIDSEEPDARFDQLLARVNTLRAEVTALRNRKVLRAANFAGRSARLARARMRRALRR